VTKIDKSFLEDALKRGARAYVHSMINMTELARLVAEDNVVEVVAENVKKGSPEPDKEELNKTIDLTKKFYLRGASFQVMMSLFEDALALDLDRGTAFLTFSGTHVDATAGLSDCFRENLAVLERDIASEGEDYLIPLHSGSAVDREFCEGAMDSILSKNPPANIVIGSVKLAVEKKEKGSRLLSYDGEMTDLGNRMLSDLNFTIEQTRMIVSQKKAYDRKNDKEQSLDI
jgi:hypothetical protein